MGFTTPLPHYRGGLGGEKNVFFFGSGSFRLGEGRAIAFDLLHYIKKQLEKI